VNGEGRKLVRKHLGWDGAYSPDIDAQQVILRAVPRELHPAAFKTPTYDDRVCRMEPIAPPTARLNDLARCWRVEAARADLNGLWDGVVADEHNDALYDEWRAACVAAAEAAVAAWTGNERENPWP
jgi:hypothetical protein